VTPYFSFLSLSLFCSVASLSHPRTFLVSFQSFIVVLTTSSPELSEILGEFFLVQTYSRTKTPSHCSNLFARRVCLRICAATLRGPRHHSFTLTTTTTWPLFRRLSLAACGCTGRLGRPPPVSLCRPLTQCTGRQT
jgi:hypothetical protein